MSTFVQISESSCTELFWLWLFCWDIFELSEWFGVPLSSHLCIIDEIRETLASGLSMTKLPSMGYLGAYCFTVWPISSTMSQRTCLCWLWITSYYTGFSWGISFFSAYQSTSCLAVLRSSRSRSAICIHFSSMCISMKSCLWLNWFSKLSFAVGILR